MDLDLHRVDYCFVGTCLPGSMKLLPGPYKQPQQIAVGDQDGVLQVFAIKKEDTQIQFKTLPTDKITTIQLGGATGPGITADKLFVAMENKVRAFTRKGKLFLSFELNLTETIKSMFVVGNDLMVCGNHVYNHYRDGKDIGSYLCGDSIVGVVALCPNNSNRVITVLACSGRVLRLLEHCRVRQTVELESVPTLMFVPTSSHGDRLLCGFADGKVEIFKINHYGMDIKQDILVPATPNSSAVTSLDMFDISGDGKDELLVGRRDGTVQVFNIPESHDMDNGIRMIFTENFQESISSIQGGCVGSAGYTEIVVSTYTGRIFGLTNQLVKMSMSDNAKVFSVSLDTKARISKLNNEIEDLEHKVAKERERYQHSTQSMSDGISAIPILPINDSIILSKDDASYHLTIEIPAPIEFVLLQSDVPVKLLNVDQNTAVISFSTCEPMSSNQLLATYRCQVNTNRVDLRLRTIEGHHGTLLAYVTPSLPPKVSQVRRYTIRPLSMHMRVHSFDESRPYNTLSLKGSFSHAEMHNWMNWCVPELPPKLPALGEANVYIFRNVFAGTLLHCDYGKGFANFKTDNITTISILKDVLTKNATKKRIKLEISTVINDASILHIIRLLGPQLEACIRTREDHKLLVALLDLDIRNEDEMRALCDEWQLVLKQQEAITKAHPEDTVVLDRLLALVTDCYIDRFKLKGINAKDKVAQFLKLLSAYDLPGLETFLADEKNVDDYASGNHPRNAAIGLFGHQMEDEGFSLDDDLI